MSNAKSNLEDLDKIISQIWVIEGSLRGLGCLFQNQTVEAQYDTSEMFGLGQLLKELAGGLEQLQSKLRSGQN